MRMNFKNTAGFTLIEMLTVIAIIGVLAAIIFPVTAAVKGRARQGQCMSNLREIVHALQQYKMDEGTVPDHLLYRENNKWVGLFPYLKSLDRYHCPDHHSQVPSDPEGDPGTFTPMAFYKPNDAEGSPSGTVNIYDFDSYDGAMETDTADGTQTFVPHYSPTRMTRVAPSEWSMYPDYPRQLRFRNPPDDTVVTWCSYHRKAPSYEPGPGGLEIFLWWDGHAKVVNSDDVLTAIGGTNPLKYWWKYQAQP